MEISNRRLICVDDEEGILDAYRAILGAPAAAAPVIQSSRGRAAAAVAVAPTREVATYEVTCCLTGEEALLKIEQAVKTGQPYVGGFFDVKLGSGIDGIETIRRAAGLDKNLLVCICSAYQDRSLDEIAKIFGDEFEGHWDFMMKPFTKMEITQKAKNLVVNWQWRRQHPPKP